MIPEFAAPPSSPLAATSPFLSAPRGRRGQPGVFGSEYWCNDWRRLLAELWVVLLLNVFDATSSDDSAVITASFSLLPSPALAVLCPPSN